MSVDRSVVAWRLHAVTRSSFSYKKLPSTFLRCKMYSCHGISCFEQYLHYLLVMSITIVLFYCKNRREDNQVAMFVCWQKSGWTRSLRMRKKVITKERLENTNRTNEISWFAETFIEISHLQLKCLCSNVEYRVRL